MLATALLVSTAAALAHHSFAPVYDGSKTVSVKGVVTQFKLVNPHASMLVESVADDGSKQTWTVEFDGRLNLTVGGWKDDTIAVGEEITVEGNPTRTGSPRMFFIRLTRADGTELVRPLLARSNSIDELRRQRAAERASKPSSPQ